MSVYKPKGSPYWHYDFQINGVRFFGSTGTADKRAAKTVEARERTEAALGNKSERKLQLTVTAAFGRYYEEHAKRLPSGDDTFYQLANLEDSLGKDRLLSEITDAEIAAFVARRRGQKAKRKKTLVSNATVNREIELLRRVLRKAQKAWGVDVTSPEWGEHLLPEADERVRELTVAEQTEFLKHLRPDFHPLARFCLLSGVRLMNAIQLKWSQIDYDAGVITFRVKSRKPGRKVHVLPLTNAIRALIANEKGRNAIFVFTYCCQRSRGKRRKGERYPFSKNGWRKPWGEALKAANIEDFRFHDTRHTAATRTLRATNNLKVVQKMLGHANIATTAKYAHVDLDDLRGAMEAVSRNSPEVGGQADSGENENVA